MIGREKNVGCEIRDARWQDHETRISNPVARTRIYYYASRNKMKIVLAVAAACEAATGFVLLVYPPIVVRLLLGADIIGVADVVSRFGGIGLIGLGVACWPNDSARQALHGMLTYSSLATLFLVYVGIRGQGIGVLLWPAVVVHVILIILLLRARSRESGK